MGSDEGGEPVEAGGSEGLGRGMTWRAAAMKTPSFAGSHFRRMKSMSERGGLAGVAGEVLRRAEVVEGTGGRVAPGDGGRGWGRRRRGAVRRGCHQMEGQVGPRLRSVRSSTFR